jgi:hypothetical protein
LRELGGDQTRLTPAVARLDHEVRHALLDRVDDDVAELPDHLAVAGSNRLSQFEAQLQP